MPDLTLTKHETVARLQLNRPLALNALTPDMLEELIVLCEGLENDTTTRVVLLEGAGENFCAGADLPQFLERLRSDPHGTADLGRRAKEALAALPQIALAAMHGHCIGGGLVLSGACDIRVAADNSRLSIPELDAGIPLSWGGMADMVRLLGETVANDLVLTCRSFDAEEALRIGLVSRVVPIGDFETEVATLSEQIAGKPSVVLRQTKQKLQRIRAGTFDARGDAAEVLEALDDDEASAVRREYVQRNMSG